MGMAPCSSSDEESIGVSCTRVERKWVGSSSVPTDTSNWCSPSDVSVAFT